MTKTNAEMLTEILNATIEKLHSERTNPKPRYTIEGESYDWPGYERHLMNKIDHLRSMIDDAADDGGITVEETTTYT